MGLKITKLQTKKPVYDVTIQDNQNFYANNAVVHNCSEISLYTDELHSFICCLSSLNLARWDEWKEYKFENGMTLPELTCWFLEGVLQEFIDRAKNNEFVISRTDMSYIFAYSKNEEDIMKSELIVCEEFRTPVVNEAEMVFELPGGSSLNEDDDRLQTASKELEEETGLVLDSDRFNYETIKQSAATLCSHRIALFSVELTQEEIDSVKKDNEVHGVVEDTERIHLHVMTVEEAIKFMDWTNIGMIMSVLKGNK